MKAMPWRVRDKFNRHLRTHPQQQGGLDASRNVVFLGLVGIIKVSESVVRQAVFVVKPIVGA